VHHSLLWCCRPSLSVQQLATPSRNCRGRVRFWQESPLRHSSHAMVREDHPCNHDVKMILNPECVDLQPLGHHFAAISGMMTSVTQDGSRNPLCSRAACKAILTVRGQQHLIARASNIYGQMPQDASSSRPARFPFHDGNAAFDKLGRNPNGSSIRGK